MSGDQLVNNDLLHVPQINICQILPDQWTILRDLKLRSLDQEPIAFADPEQERAKYLARTEGEWRAILSGHMSGGKAGETIMFFARDNTRYVGMVSAIIPEGQSDATIQHMYVDNEGYRGLGVGKQLLTALLRKLKDRSDVKKTKLSVVATQIPARKLYGGLGFKEIKTLQGSATRGEKSFDEIEMELKF
jgi:ribosomal protein S18 acetylase RimI-like enzyme